MAAMSRGRNGPSSRVRKQKGGTESSRRHHFESFTQRIAKLNIDPIRRTRHALDDTSESPNFSYFKTSFDKWRELNMSESFTAFCKAAEPLCESLPQILHYDDRIMDLLVEYTGNGDSLSLEPLLDLVSQFAHDLGVKFEKHFALAVTTIGAASTRHAANVEVIEWSFTCLAWLFKYLSRLLVPDLRPLFDLLAPLLGKVPQKPYISTFCAEALSFLVRKAGTTYHKDKKPLQLIIAHILGELEDPSTERPAVQYQEALMTLFIESIKGIRNGLHSSGCSIYEELLQHTMTLQAMISGIPEESPSVNIVRGVTIASIHHTNAETFAPLLEIILNNTRSLNSTSSDAALLCSVSLMFAVSGTRQGSRVDDWSSFLDCVSHLIELVDQRETNNDSILRPEIYSVTAISFQSCPLETAIPRLRLLEALSTNQWEPYFLPFCNLFSELGNERFRSLLLPYLQSFITTKWNQYGEELCLLLPRMARSNGTLRSSLKIPQQWQSHMSESFRQLNRSSRESLDELVLTCNGYLSTSEIVQIDSTVKDTISLELLKLIKSVLAPSHQDYSRLSLFAAGKGLEWLVNNTSSSLSIAEIWPSLCTSASIYGNHEAFWRGVLAALTKSSTNLEFNTAHLDQMSNELIRCLSSPSHDLRLLSLNILQKIHAVTKGAESSSLEKAIIIEETQITLQTARVIGVHIRDLASTYSTASSDPWLRRAIPSFLFGLLNVKFSQIWEDSCGALKNIASSKEGEKAVWGLVFDWLQGCPVEEEPSVAMTVDNSQAITHAYKSDFECSNLAKLSQVVAKSKEELQELNDRLRTMFEENHHRILFSTSQSRTQALRVLNEIPQVAEKNSRLLVPVLLDWASNPPPDDALIEFHHPDEDNVDRDDLLKHKWIRREQKALLALFTKFINPKVLYKSSDVFSAQLSFLTNGDLEIQKSALKGIMTWKNKRVLRYEENLFNLLDDARFREEISVFLDTGKENSKFREDDQPDVLPIILRLLYGKIISRSSSGGGAQIARRKAVFVALTRFGDDAIRQFLSVSLGKLAGTSLFPSSTSGKIVDLPNLITPRKQFGLLNLLEDLLGTLKTQVTGVVSNVVEPILYCLVKSSREIAAASQNQEPDSGSSVQISLLKSVRQTGFRCLILLFESCPSFSWKLYQDIIFKELVLPRLDTLATDTAHSISGILRLFAAFASSHHTAPFLASHDTIMTAVAECLAVPFAKDEVKLFVLKNILGKLITILDAIDEEQAAPIRTQVLQPYTTLFLNRIGMILRKSPGKELLETGIRSVVDLAPFVTSNSESRELVEISTFLLHQPIKRVNPATKSDLIKIIQNYLPSCKLPNGDDLLNQVFEEVSSLLAFFKDRESRMIICNILQEFAKREPTLAEVADLCVELNSFSPSRLDELDFERRSQAFGIINDCKYASFTSRNWRPLVFNMLYDIKNLDELSIRANASFSLRRFAEVAGKSDGEESNQFKIILTSIVLPAIQGGMRDSSELVRLEYISVLAEIVRQFPEWELVADMHGLLANNDEEASFFTNILHIQQHRRLRALRRLVGEVQSGKIQSTNISHFFIPLTEHFIFDKGDDDNAHSLAAEAVNTIGIITEWVEWTQYKALLRRFTSYIQSKAEMEKTVIRLIGVVIEAASRAGKTKLAPTEPIPADVSSSDSMDVDIMKSKLATTMPSQEKLSKELVQGILPPLTAYLHHKDESAVSLRILVAVAVVKILMLLPVEKFSMQLPAVLMDLCHIFKSKAQESRDMARRVLADICALIGPSYFGFVLKELRTALQRGSHLHILSFTVHYLLENMSSTLKPGDLDYCIADIVIVVMDDVFGLIGQEKDAEEYTSKLREVKQKKSPHTLEMIARVSSLTKLSELVKPLQMLLLEKIDFKMLGKVDELLHRIREGILHNGSVKDRDLLVFCYEIIQEAYRVERKTKNTGKTEEDERTKRYLITMKAAARQGKNGAITSHIFKMAQFSLELLRVILQRHEELQTPANISGFMPIIGDALVQGGQEEVQMAAIRLLTAIIKVPLAEIDRNAVTYVSEAVRIIKGSPSTTTLVAQDALKLVSAVLQERPSIEAKEKDIAYLLQKIKSDLDEPDRQGVAFRFLKAVMFRKIIITEVYEVMDTVAAIMVTNHSRTARELSRGVYVRFFMEYPQNKDRLTKQLAFLVKNLSYQFYEGRQSVLEALHLLINRVGDDLIQTLLNTIFVPLVMVMINDERDECREMAGALVKASFDRADNDTLKSFLALLRTWVGQDEKMLLRRVAIQCWTLFIESQDGQTREAPFFLQQLGTIIEQGRDTSEEENWELLYYALQAFLKLCKSVPKLSLKPDLNQLWDNVQGCLCFPHLWVKLSSAQLIGLLFADYAKHNAKSGFQVLPLASSGGLRLDGEDMIRIAKTSLKVLGAVTMTEELSKQTARNLVFLGRCFAVNGLTWRARSLTETSETDSEEEESDEDSESKSKGQKDKLALEVLFDRLANIIRREPSAIQHSALYAKSASLQLIATLSSITPVQALMPSVPTILLPLHILTDPATTRPRSTDTSFTEAYDGLVTTSQEIMNMLQKKLGTTDYLKILQNVRHGVMERRQERRVKRRIEAVSMPEKWNKEKKRRHEVKRVKRKEKGMEARGRRRGW